jgi:hypothetical protein
VPLQKVIHDYLGGSRPNQQSGIIVVYFSGVDIVKGCKGLNRVQPILVPNFAIDKPCLWHRQISFGLAKLCTDS